MAVSICVFNTIYGREQGLLDGGGGGDWQREGRGQQLVWLGTVVLAILMIIHASALLHMVMYHLCQLHDDNFLVK